MRYPLIYVIIVSLPKEVLNGVCLPPAKGICQTADPRIYDKSNQNYGAPKITRELRKSGIRIAERTVGTYMKEMGIKAQWIKPWTTTTRDSDFSSQLHNILNEQFNPESPVTVWCTDITYNKGSQYVSKTYCNATAGIQRSYSHTGYPYDNACIEAFHSLIKREWLNRFQIQDYSHAYRLVFEYIETFYNTVRIHSHCDYMSPNDFEKLYEKVAS